MLLAADAAGQTERIFFEIFFLPGNDSYFEKVFNNEAELNTLVL